MKEHEATGNPDQDAADALIRLIEIMRRLRDPENGCPWDVEQDFHSIMPYTIEEAYEVADAIERQDWDDLEGELGDLLLQAVYHAQMGSEAGLFDFGSLAARVCRKMVDRHPHVFGDSRPDRSSLEQEVNWEAGKAEERARRAQPGTLDGIARALPALTRAAKLQRRAATVGFDWPEQEGVVRKIREELDELEDAIALSDANRVLEEFGDLLLSCVNLSRHLGVDPESALRTATRKFVDRFEEMERTMRAEGLEPTELGLLELEEYWNRAKRAV